LTDRCMD